VIMKLLSRSGVSALLIQRLAAWWAG